MNDKFLMKHTCKNCKYYEDGYCKKDNVFVEEFGLQEFTCCEMSEQAKIIEKLLKVEGN